MNNQQTVDALEALKLHGMAVEYDSIVTLPEQKRPGREVTVAKLVEAEQEYRREKRTALYLRTSKLRYENAVIEDVICSTARNFTKDQLDEYSDCGFVRRAENLLITGLTGCGKSFLANALGRQACCLGMRTEYFNMNRFIEQVTIAKASGTFLKLLNHLNKDDLLIWDDFGLAPMTADARLAILQILEDRYEKKSVIIASQLPVNKWYDYIAEPTLADAIMDRIINNANIIQLEGDSMRRLKKK